MKRVIVIQARMTSTRLPGKILMNVAGRPMLAQQVGRLKQCELADEIVVATTSNVTDNRIVELARREGVGYFRGSEQDVLERFVGAAQQAQASVVVRVTADCPLIDSLVVDQVIRELVDHAAACDYASNVIQRTYPRGLDVEALFFDTLQRVDRLARCQPAREHVTMLIYSELPDLFLCRSVEDSEDNSALRWTADTAQGLQLIRALYEALDLGTRRVSYRELVAYVRTRPELMSPNAGIQTWEPPRKPI